jgi:hypothetical protein
VSTFVRASMRDAASVECRAVCHHACLQGRGAARLIFGMNFCVLWMGESVQRVLQALTRLVQ